MSLPDFQTIMRPLLAAAAELGPRSWRDLAAEVARYFDLTEADVALRLSGGNQTVFANRVSWA
ncbi:MAG: winged helix-turn-helix domain-containing protein, partial [Chloroflexota bacterium]